MRLLLTSLLLGAGILVGACSDAPSKKECEKLLDHVIDIYTPARPGEQLTPQVKKDLEEQQKAVAKVVGKDFVSKCTDTLPKAHVECALKARSEADLGKCEEN